MNMNADKVAGIRRKLREGQQLLAEAVNEDDPRLGLALIKLHGALEDTFRIEIARRAPHLRSDVEDARQTNWRDLIGYAKQYMALSEQEIRAINRANFLRQEVAHGGNYEGSREELVRYARFVERWCGQAGSVRPAGASRPASPAPAFSFPMRTVPRQARWSCLPVLGVILLFFCICWLCGLSYVGSWLDMLNNLLDSLLRAIVGGWIFLRIV